MIDRIDSIDLDEVFAESNTPYQSIKILEPGDAVGVDRGLYQHYGIYCGDDKVIHYSSNSSDFGINNCIRETTFAEFLRESQEFFIAHFDDEENSAFPVKETIKRARSRIGEQSYNLIHNNCEHLIHWCKTGSGKSTQVETVIDLLHETLS